MAKVCIAVAVANNRVIGKDGKLPWRIPSEMQWFKKLTNGHIVIMGRKTWESLPIKFRPLSNRHNIVVTSSPIVEESAPHRVASSLTEALGKARTFAHAAVAADAMPRDIFLIGGERIYREALDNNLVDIIYMTRIYASFEGDTFFPIRNPNNWTTEPEDWGLASNLPGETPYTVYRIDRKW